MADDLGFNDVSLRGSMQFLTPNIDALGYNGIILNKHYVPPMCTPSRASLLTGKYTFHTGLQYFVISSDQPYGLRLEEKIMPEYFREAGYRTHMIGKWHLGFHKHEYTPYQRGYDSFYGYWGPYIDYYDHSLIMMNRNYTRGYDMRKNNTTTYEKKGLYATELFTQESETIIKNHNYNDNPLFLIVNHLAPHTANEDDPMQAPIEEVNKFNHINNEKRRTYAAMVSLLDKSVGRIVQAINDADQLDNTIILFYSDNGAPSVGQHANAGSNYPLRGQKDGPWEGGVRNAAVLWSSLLRKRHRVSNQYFHVSDWLPTLASAAGIHLNLTSQIDGINQWNHLSKNCGNKRKEVLHNIDEITGYSSYTLGVWKYVNGTRLNGKYDTWLGDIRNETIPNLSFDNYVERVVRSPTSRALSRFWQKTNNTKYRTIKNLQKKLIIKCNPVKSNCEPLIAPCLFNINDDPCEYNNLANEYPLVLAELKRNVDNYFQTLVPSLVQPSDPNANPALHNNVWSSWLDNSNAPRSI